MKNSLHSILAPSHSHPAQTEVLVCWSLGSRPTQAQELFAVVLCLFGTTCHCLSIQPFSRDRQEESQDKFLWLGLFPHRYRHAWWPVDVTVRFLWFYYWTLIWLSCHWAWLCWGYWCYKTAMIGDYIYQSINQSNFYSANIPGEARLSGATTKSVFNSKIEETFP